MRYRAVIIPLIFIAALVAMPVSASTVNIFNTPFARTGTASVILSPADGSGEPQQVSVTYVVGDVREVTAVDAGAGAIAIAAEPDRFFITTRPAQPAAMVMARTFEPSYTINTIALVDSSGSLPSSHYLFTAPASAANYYADEVPAGQQHEWIDLDWKDVTKDLCLTVYAPDSVLGPFNDTSDGKTDGRIFLDVSSTANVTPGTWFFKVMNTGFDRMGYTLNTYSA